MTDELHQLIDAAITSGQAASEAMDQINQATVDKGVWNALYQQGEAIGQLTTALLFLVDTKQ